MKHAIHCETEEEARRVLQIASERRLSWDDYSMLEGSDTMFDVYELNTAYYINGDFVSVGTAEDAEWFGYTIVKARDFIEADLSGRRKVEFTIKVLNSKMFTEEIEIHAIDQDDAESIADQYCLDHNAELLRVHIGGCKI